MAVSPPDPNLIASSSAASPRQLDGLRRQLVRAQRVAIVALLVAGVAIAMALVVFVRLGGSLVLEDGGRSTRIEAGRITIQSDADEIRLQSWPRNSIVLAHDGATRAELTVLMANDAPRGMMVLRGPTYETILPQGVDTFAHPPSH